MKPLETEQDYHAAMARFEQIFASATPGTPEGDEFELLADQIEDWERRSNTFALNAEKWEAFQTALEAPPRPMPRLKKLLEEPSCFDAESPNLETRAAMAEAEAMVLGPQLTPGTKEAREKGCSCPVADNENMRGVKNANGEPMFVISGACSLHRRIVEGWNRELD